MDAITVWITFNIMILSILGYFRGRDLDRLEAKVKFLEAWRDKSERGK